MNSPSASSRTSPPRRRSSVVSAASRSVSWPRMCARPVRCEGRSASAASAAITVDSSLTSRRFASMPRSSRAAAHGERPARRPRPTRPSPGAGRAARPRPGSSRPASAGPPPCRRSRGPRRGTGAALDRSGSMTRVPPATGPGSTRQTPGSGTDTATPERAQDVHGHVGVRLGRDEVAAGVDDLDALVVARARRAAGRTRTATRRTRRCAPTRRRRRPVPWIVNGIRPRPPSSTRRPRPGAGRRSGSPSGVRARTRSPSKLTGPSASAATGGRNRMTVPASPVSTCAPCSGPGVTTQSAPSSAIPTPIAA